MSREKKKKVDGRPSFVWLVVDPLREHGRCPFSLVSEVRFHGVFHIHVSVCCVMEIVLISVVGEIPPTEFEYVDDETPSDECEGDENGVRNEIDSFTHDNSFPSGFIRVHVYHAKDQDP